MTWLPSRLLVVCALALSLATAGCTTWQSPADVNDAALRSRAVTDARNGVRVQAAVLSEADSQRMLGADLNKTGVQPVWIEVRNGTSQPLWLLRSGTDPDYYAPLEVAWSLHTLLDSNTNTRIDATFKKLAFKNPIAPGEVREGILFIHLEHRTMLLNIDLFGEHTLIPFTLFPPVPDGGGGGGLVSFRYPDSQLQDCADLATLRTALERLPCCAIDARDQTQGDPLNVVFVGEVADIGPAAVRRGYRLNARADDMAQLVFGRPPDAVLRKQAQAGAPSNWVRAWLAPIRFEGRSVYLAQAGRAVGGRFAQSSTKNIVLGEDVDEARNLLIQDMMYSGGLEKLGFVTGVGEVSDAQPPSALRGTRYHTDGLRAVLFFATRPLGLNDVEFLQWVPYLDAHQ
jgi:hypothetical protein